MRFTFSSKLFVLTLVLLLALPTYVRAQSTTNGAISGIVTDPTGAVLPDITVTLKSTEKGFTQTARTNGQGFYQFPLLEPGTYAISISAPSFKTLTATTTVSVGQTSTVNAKLEVGGTGTTVEVSGEAPLLQTESSEISTTFNAREIAEVPNPGNDLSFIAQTAPGSVMNTEGGYGNFSSFGISASSNLFTLNGMYDNDPFLNLNNSGATNLLLGQNEVQEATVITNGYSGQYGGFAGANVNYITKSGSNNWHGNANYWWNGRVMNGNDYFNKDYAFQAPLPRQFDNANQYAASFGGPIIKNKAFFFWNYEGLRVVLPTSAFVSMPTASSPGVEGFQTAVINNLSSASGADLPASVPFYNTMFNFFNTNPHASSASPILATSTGPSCGYIPSGEPGAGNPYGFTDPVTGQLFGYNYLTGATGLPCTATYHYNPETFTHEYLTAGRFDFNLTNSDKVFVRLQEDIGQQATYTDAINPIFNATSYQPEYQGQISWNRAIGLKAANNLVASMQYYEAIFEPANINATLSAFPTTVLLGDGTISNIGGEDYVWPQGRNVTGYQVVDDFSYSLNAKHTLKLGLYFHRNLVSDHDYGLFTSGYDLPLDISSYFYGGNSPNNVAVLLQNFLTTPVEQIKLYQLGWYIQDEWKPTSNLKFMIALRADHNSNPFCLHNCFSRLTSSWGATTHDATVPYNQAMASGLAQAIPSFTNVEWQPRFGFSYAPGWAKNTVFRGGFGFFMDTFPGQIADTLSANSPNLNAFEVLLDNLSPTQTPTNLFSDAAADNAALAAGFPAGQTLGQIAAADTYPFFSPPNIGTVAQIKAPVYYEWNFEVQHSIGNNSAFTINYVGNHGIHETTFFNDLNTYCSFALCSTLGFPAAQLPGSPTATTLAFGGWDPRFGTVSEIRSAAVSNYNGLSTSFQHRFQRGLQFQINYTFSHALDEVSNGGFNPFGGVSILNPIGYSLRPYSYGNADYDVRHYLSANYVYEVPKGPTPALKGWQLSGTVFARGGLPYTVVNSAVANDLSGVGFGGAMTATFAGSSYPGCTGPKGTIDTLGVTNAPCFAVSNFPDTFAFGEGGTPGNQLATGIINQRRNQLYGPRYFDTDFTIMKYTQIPHWETAKLGIGAQFFNLFNHPNFYFPNNNINSPDFGAVTGTVNPPTSILGSFLGGDASVRLIQLTAKFNF